MIGISVVICCYNSVARLKPTLIHLADQQFSAANVEIILVDNNSNDGTAAFAQNAWAESGSPFAFHIIKEMRPGLSNARAAGIRFASFPYVVFCDDDNWLCKEYLRIVVELFEEHSNVAIVGGCGYAVFEKAPPSWFNQLKGFGYAVGSEGRATGFVPTVYGAGMAVRRSVMLQLFDNDVRFLLSDRSGAALHSGGDTEICQLVTLIGHQVYFDTRLRFAHFMPANRMKWSYYLKLRESFGRAEVYLQLYNPSATYLFVDNGARSFRLTLAVLRYAARYFYFLVASKAFQTPRCAAFFQELSRRVTLLTHRHTLAGLAADIRKRHKEMSVV